MFKINPKKVLIKTPSIYDFQAHVPQEVYCLINNYIREGRISFDM